MPGSRAEGRGLLWASVTQRWQASDGSLHRRRRRAVKRSSAGYCPTLVDVRRKREHVTIMKAVS
jgi:hypothetical protein